MTRTRIARACVALAMSLACSVAVAAQPAKDVACLATRGRTDYKVQTRCMRVTIADATRTYRLYAPRTQSKQSMPIILVLHGGGGSGSTMEALTKGQFNRIADRQRLLVVYPDGVDRTWRHSRVAPSQTFGQTANDIEFLRAVLADVERKYPVNRQRVFVAGMESGALLAYRIGCEAPDMIAAIATVAATLPTELSAACRPERVTPLLMINGTDDSRVPWLGGTMKLADNSAYEVLSASETFDHWSAMGDCALPDTGMPRDRVANDGTTFIRHLARECRDGAQVRLYELVGGGHTWPGGDALGQRNVGQVSREINATESIWEFFARYGRTSRGQ